MTDCDDQTLLLSARRRGSAAGGAALLLAGGTLVCCALPILLVSIGLGTAVAALTSSVPWLVSLSQYRWMFATAGFTLLATAALILRPGRACPGNPALARPYARADQWNRRVLWTGVSVWSIGFFMAYAWLPLQRWIGD